MVTQHNTAAEASGSDNPPQDVPQFGPTADGTAPLSREEVLASLEENDGRVQINFVRADGARPKPLKLPAENATKFINFQGVKYEKKTDTEWHEIGPADENSGFGG